MASVLVEKFSSPGETIFDPFCGSGTILLEGWLRGRNVIGTDLNPYAVAITKAKLHPPADVRHVHRMMTEISEEIEREKRVVDLRRVTPWVRSFFHPKTLRETILWFRFLKERRNSFLRGCLLGILHHQRPGFLSYPSSNAVPYLRSQKFPKEKFPKMYEYRDVTTRMEKKVGRMLKRVPAVDRDLKHDCQLTDSIFFEPDETVDAIITSPPYMRRLSYGRDNRLRLWFLGVHNGDLLDSKISPNEAQFLRMMRTCLHAWKRYLAPGGHCILILGDNYSTKYRAPLPKAISAMAIEEVGGYDVESEYQDAIPEANRVRREYQGIKNETILVLNVK
jgi:methylase of polypeptide subunit release factors